MLKLSNVKLIMISKTGLIYPFIEDITIERGQEVAHTKSPKMDSNLFKIKSMLASTGSSSSPATKILVLFILI